MAERKGKQLSRAELDELTIDELAKLAKRRQITVARGDGEDGEPLHDDYVNALAEGAPAKPTKSVALRERVYFEGQIYGPGSEDDDYMVDVPEDYPEAREPKAKARG